MKEVRFYEETEDELLDFAVIIAEAEGKLVFCKHRERNTYEIPGGHREEGEAIEEAARRELYEETGAVEYTLLPVCVYSVTDPCRFGGVNHLACFIMRKFLNLNQCWSMKLKKSFSWMNGKENGHILKYSPN